MKNKILFVVQRYGLEVNGGSEAYCRQIAEKLSSIYDVSVLTTCAEDYVTWENKYQEGIEKINDITVIRKKVVEPRTQKKFSKATDIINFDKENLLSGIEWQKAQGPYSLELLNYLSNHKEEYDVIIYMTYLYFTTYFGIQIAPEKSILIPTAHDEPPIYFGIFNSIFHLPRCILYLTNSEKNFVTKKFHNNYVNSDIVGVGIDIEKDVENINLKDRFHIEDEYLIYLGRIDESKGCKNMIDYFLEYKAKYNNNLKLALAGKTAMNIPVNNDILNLGFVSEIEKINLLKNSKALILPSEFESLSLSTLEAMYFGIPVLVNGKCDVLKDHAILSKAGLYYMNKLEFIESLAYIDENPEIMKKMGENGVLYVEKNYRWDVVIEKYKNAIEKVRKINQ
mgnify:FL=1